MNGPFDQRLPGTLAIGAAQHCHDILESAERICGGHFDLLGHRNLEFGDPPDWHLDPISGRSAPRLHWTRLDPLDYATVGDGKVVWELNRHQWLVHLSQTYFLTRDERYAYAVVRYLRSWLDANPPGMGINWTSSLEVAFRLIAWCWALLLIRESPALTPSLFSEVVRSVRTHGTHIERYLSYYFSPNTHLTGEALGLLYAAILFPDLKRAEHWQSLGRRILVQEIERQALSDGVYIERSTCYQRYTIDTYLHFLLLGARAGFDIPAAVKERVQSMLDFLVTLRQPNGAMPTIGDADGGWVLPLSRTSPEDFSPTFSTAAVLFQEPRYAWAAGRLAPDTLWLLGTPALEAFQALGAAAPPASDACSVFPSGGFAVMRSGWDEDSHALIFDTGPLGCPVSSGHGHADLLSIQCSVFGHPHLVDAGTGCYAEPPLRNFFRGTAAHSTVMVDGMDQAQPAGPFAWKNRPAARLLQWTSNETLAFADAEHDAFGQLSDSVRHRRRMIFVKPRYWVLVDDLTGAGTHRIDVRFQFAPIEVQIDIAGWVRATRDGRRGLLLRGFSSTWFAAELREGCQSPLEGWISPDYGRLEPAPVLVYTAITQLPVRLVTLLWPSEQIHDEPPRVEFIFGRGDCVAGLVLPDLAETVLFEDGEPRVERKPADPSPIHTNSEPTMAFAAW